MLEPRSAFAEDTAAHQCAAALGFQLTRRYRAIEVTDEAALQSAGFVTTKPRPDYARIARALDAGERVPGAEFRSREYVLRPAGGER